MCGHRDLVVQIWSGLGLLDIDLHPGVHDRLANKGHVRVKTNPGTNPVRVEENV